jgi:hypothetical protein
MFEASGRRATFYMKEGGGNSDGTELLYVHEGILQRYAEQKGKRIVCLTWGEREIHHSVSSDFWDKEGRPEGLTMNDTIFKYFDVD